MRIAFVLPSLANKAPIIVAHDLILAIVRQGAATCIVYHFDDIRELEFPCETRHITSLMKLDFTGFDIIHTHMLRPDVLIALQHRKFRQAKLVSTLHSYMDKDLANTYSSVLAFFAQKIWIYGLRKFDKVVCLSKDMQQYYSNFIAKEKLTFIYNGRALKEEQQNIQIPQGESESLIALKSRYKVIGAAGGLSKIKGYDQIIKAVSLSNNFAAVIIGDGREKEALIDLATQLNVSERVIFLGYKPNVRDYYNFFDLYAVTSHSEGFSLVLLEAASAGIPTVCSDLNIFKEIFNDQQVVYYRLSDVADLHRAFKYAVEQAEKLSINIHNKFISSYTSDVMAANYLNVYKTLVNS